jgi:hypothetical protein
MNWQRWQAKLRNGARFCSRRSVLTGTVAVAGVALTLLGLWQTAARNRSDRYSEFREIMRELTYIEQSGSVVDCTGDTCLGSLSLSESQFIQYELLAVSALQLAAGLDVLEPETLNLASALYKCGHLQRSTELASQIAISENELLRFRSALLLAEIAYFRRDTDSGDKQIDMALLIGGDARSSVPTVQQRVMRAEAHLTRAKMKAAIGLADESEEAQRIAFSEISKLPDTDRVGQLKDSLANTIAAAASDGPFRGQDFDHYRAEVLAPRIEPEPYHESGLLPESEPDPPSAPDSGVRSVLVSPDGPAAPAAPTAPLAPPNYEPATGR